MRQVTSGVTTGSTGGTEPHRRRRRRRSVWGSRVSVGLGNVEFLEDVGAVVGTRVSVLSSWSWTGRMEGTGPVGARGCPVARVRR